MDFFRDFLSGQTLTPLPLLVAGPLRKELFLRLPLVTRPELVGSGDDGSGWFVGSEQRNLRVLPVLDLVAIIS